MFGFITKCLINKKVIFLLVCIKQTLFLFMNLIKIDELFEYSFFILNRILKLLKNVNFYLKLFNIFKFL